MNERIRELAEQAGYKPLGTFADELMEIYNKKFAELIIEECADFLMDTMDDHFAAEQLVEHFGVE